MAYEEEQPIDAEVPDKHDMTMAMVYSAVQAFGQTLRLCEVKNDELHVLDTDAMVTTAKQLELADIFKDLFGDAIDKAMTDKPAEGKQLVLYANLPSVNMYYHEDSGALDVSTEWRFAWVEDPTLHKDKTSDEGIVKRLAACSL